MIAVISKRQKCVWGLGQSREQAMQDAKRQIAAKPHQAGGVGALDYARVDHPTPEDMCGDDLYGFVVVADAVDVRQMDLFGRAG